MKQAALLRTSTERVFRKAGVTVGMRVLDMGCGVGDVSFLAAEIVGLTGTVVGVDTHLDVLSIARQRAREFGLTHVAFEQGEVDRFRATEPFDAVVGRFVLMYQADPVVTLSHVYRLLKTGGILVVQEPDFGVGIITRPKVSLWQQVQDWTAETFRRGGVHYDIGGRLYPLFRQARLPGPLVLEHVSVGGGAAMRPFCENSAEILSSLLPSMEQFGVATAAEVQADTLADRLEQATCSSECQVTYLPLVAAWTTRTD
jgi:SAM-dependent methyltransferase